MTSGYENSPAVILQGHIDMVAVKEEDCIKDMEKEGLDLEIRTDIYLQNRLHSVEMTVLRLHTALPC